MAEKFDKYYEYFVKRRGRKVRERRINLGFVSIDLRGGRVDIFPLFKSRSTEGVAMVDGESVKLVGRGAEVLKGKHVVVKNARLHLVEGERVELFNANVGKVVGRYVAATNCKVEEIEAEEVVMINAKAEKVAASRGRFTNCVIEKLVYQEHYESVNTVIHRVEKATTLKPP
ncbi:hypothetical protein [Pyrobaculum sp.]|uniref:hypothetical protein n=1 Tax=Pyrobaculum sp. TaxID=2004705 RepID=UPI003169E1E0